MFCLSCSDSCIPHAQRFIGYFYQNAISYYPEINEVRKHDDMDKGTDLSQLSRSLKGIPAPCVSGVLQAQG